MGALEHGGVVALVGALAGCVIVGRWIYNSYEKDASPGERVTAGVVLVAILGVVVIVAKAMIDAQSSGS